MALSGRLCRIGCMDAIMKCCVIIHNMIVSEIWPLECDVLNSTRRVNVEEDMKSCFEQLHRSTGIEIEKISATCELSRYLRDTYEYMSKRRLVFKNVVANR